MPSNPTLAAEVTSIVADYEGHANVGLLVDGLRRLAESAPIDELRAAVAPFQNLPEVIIPVYETIVRRAPADAQGLVVLANAYWLTGRGPEIVGDLARRAIDADPGNRGAWHLWALAESNVRDRMQRWQAVTERFPSDQLARAALADNATSLAGAEHDPIALDLAIRTYEGLLAESINPAQSRALVETLDKLRAWRL